MKFDKYEIMRLLWAKSIVYLNPNFFVVFGGIGVSNQTLYRIWADSMKKLTILSANFICPN